MTTVTGDLTPSHGLHRNQHTWYTHTSAGKHSQHNNKLIFKNKSSDKYTMRRGRSLRYRDLSDRQSWWRASGTGHVGHTRAWELWPVTWIDKATGQVYLPPFRCQTGLWGIVNLLYKSSSSQRSRAYIRMFSHQELSPNMYSANNLLNESANSWLLKLCCVKFPVVFRY